MPFKPLLLLPGALLCIAAALPAAAQPVYKCGTARAVKYSDLPCPGRTVDTADAPVPGKPGARHVDARRIEQNRAMARAMRRMPGESDEAFAARRRRAPMLATDRAECARLDVRMPVEQASLSNPDPEEVSKARTALEQSRKRFGELRC